MPTEREIFETEWGRLQDMLHAYSAHIATGDYADAIAEAEITFRLAMRQGFFHHERKQHEKTFLNEVAKIGYAVGEGWAIRAIDEAGLVFQSEMQRGMCGEPPSEQTYRTPFLALIAKSAYALGVKNPAP